MLLLLSGIWQRLTGQYAKIKAQNEMETLLAWQRDRAEKDNLVFEQLKERHALQRPFLPDRKSWINFLANVGDSYVSIVLKVNGKNLG